jgi:hypothetical protein
VATPRRSTGKAAPAKAGAASAVAKDSTLTVESETPVTVDSPTNTPTMEDAEAAADAEDARQAAEREIELTRDAAKSRHERRIAVVPEGTAVAGAAPQNAPDVVTEDPPVVVDPKQEVPSVPEPVPTDRVVNREVAEATAQLIIDSGGDEKAARDIQALRALADTAGDPVTPYGGTAPAPLPPLPPLREVHNWAREGDETLTARVVVDGFRPRVNGGYRFARRGDRIVAPKDIVEFGIKRGVLRLEEV